MQIARVLLLSIILFWLPACTDNGQSESLTRFEQVLDRGTIRCSYLNYAPYFMTDPNDGAHSGIFFDVMEEIGKRSGLEIDWAEEVGYEVIFTGLNSGRHDVFCAGLWANTTRAKAGTFSEPVFYSVIKAWVRSDDDRFADGLGILNDGELVVATIDGAMEDIIANADFPNAPKESLPQLSPFTQNLQNIISKKADITFAEPGIINDFLESNPGMIKDAAPEMSLRVFGNSLVSPLGEPDLEEFLDIAMQELLYSGHIDKILDKYEDAPGIFPRAAKPYDPDSAILKLPN